MSEDELNKMKEKLEGKQESQEKKEHHEEVKKEKTVKEVVPKSDYDELEDRYKRILAEFENYKKRSNKEREMLYTSVLSEIIASLLPIVDNLENAIKVDTKDEEYKIGIELVLKQFKDVLTAQGVEEIKALGETFDPELHEAISMIQDPNLGEKEVAQEYRKGYKIGTKVIRHSMVIVAN